MNSNTLVHPRSIWPVLARDPLMLAGLTLLVALVGLSMLAPLITWHDPAALAPRLPCGARRPSATSSRNWTTSWNAPAGATRICSATRWAA